MIVKKGTKWLVKDSSGKKVLGTHSTKKLAIQQLAAIESSKARKEKQLKEYLYSQQNLINEFYMLKLSELKEKKEFLENELKEIKMKNLITLLSEQPYHGGGGPPGQFGQGQQGQVQPQQQTQQRNLRARRKQVLDGQPNAEDNTSEDGDPFPMAQGHMGIALTPQVAGAQTELLTKYFDDPKTARREVAYEPTWQNVQTSIANSVGQEVNQKLRQFGLLG